MNIEQIMKTYFDKIEEIKSKGVADNEALKEQIMNNEYQKNLVQLRLEKLKNNKDTEIEEYVNQAVSDRPDFYSGYGAMIRKDLQQSYLTKEQSLENEINEIDNKIATINAQIQNNLKEIEKFHRVDIREIVGVKQQVRKELFTAKKELELKYKEASLNLDVVMLKLSSFKHTYDAEHNITNGAEYRRLFEQSNSLIEARYGIENQLKKVEEYISLTELTLEESKIIMMSMTPWEREEYDRRKALATESPIEELSKETIDEEPIDEEIEELSEETIDEEPIDEEIEEISEETIDEEPIVEEPIDEETEALSEETIQEETEERSEESHEEETEEISKEPIEEYPANDLFELEQPEPVQEPVNLDENITIAESGADLLNTIFNEIVDSARTINKVKLDPNMLLRIPGTEAAELDEEAKIDLPNGEYISKRDISRALDNYVRKNKGRKFGIKGLPKTVGLTRGAAKEVKKALRECSTIKLLREKKLGYFDIKRVYGKAKADKYSDLVELGRAKTKLPAGDYVNLREFYGNLTKLFTEKSPSWIEKLVNEIKTRVRSHQEEQEPTEKTR